MEGKVNTRLIFDKIADKYDLLNHLLSAGVDVYWRKRLVAEIDKGNFFLDVAAGTLDVAIEIKRKFPKARVIGLDPSRKMLINGKKKKIGQLIYTVQGEGENIPFPDQTFDVVTIAFGIRNVKDRKRVLSEFWRVLKKNGKLLILEFSTPKKLIGKIYGFYFKKILPIIGGLISKNKEAYEYLPNSVKDFPSPTDFAEEISKIGFSIVNTVKLSFGICYLYIAKKP